MARRQVVARAAAGWMFAAIVASTQAALALPAFKAVDAFPNLPAFDRPVYMTHAGDGSGRLFVVEQYSGLLRVFDAFTTVSSTRTVLDLKSRLRPSLGNEEGFLGLAFHPDFRNNGQFFVYYTAPDSGPVYFRKSVLSRFYLPLGSDVAESTSEAILLTVGQPESNHNGGCLQFGPDGDLYIGLGDGGGAGDPFHNGQNLGTLLGSILRIGVDFADDGLAYHIPDDNPFVDLPAARHEIWCYGMRNPWRFSFDVPTGRLWCGDVGQSAYEEIDIIQKGKNYGWNIMEASHCYPSGASCNTTGLTYPIWEYGRTLGQSTTGGYVYRGSRLPELYGLYIYADYVQGRIWALDYDGAVVRDNVLIYDATFTVSSFGVDAQDELYFTSLGTGRVYQLDYVTPPTGTRTPTPTATVTPTATDTPTDTPTPTATVTPTFTATVTPTPPATDTPIDTPTPSSTFTWTPTATWTQTSTDTPTPSFTPTGTLTPTDTPTWTATASHTPTSTATVAPTPRVPDYDASGVVDGLDLLRLLEAWGTTDESLDLSGDGRIDQADLLRFSVYWDHQVLGQP